MNAGSPWRIRDKTPLSRKEPSYESQVPLDPSARVGGNLPIWLRRLKPECNTCKHQPGASWNIGARQPSCTRYRNSDRGFEERGCYMELHTGRFLWLIQSNDYAEWNRHHVSASSLAGQRHHHRDLRDEHCSIREREREYLDFRRSLRQLCLLSQRHGLQL